MTTAATKWEPGKSGALSPADFARKAQEESLQLVADAAQRGNTNLLAVLIWECQEKRNKLAEKHWQEYRLFRASRDAFPIGVINRDNVQYLRDSEDGGRTVRYTHCPDQAFCDRVNNLAEAYGLTGRLETKHEEIYRLRLAALRRGELTWTNTAGVWTA